MEETSWHHGWRRLDAALPSGVQFTTIYLIGSSKSLQLMRRYEKVSDPSDTFQFARGHVAYGIV